MQQILRLIAQVKYGFRLFIIAVVLFTTMSASSQLPTAQQVANQMKVGWNLGNTLEAICGETAWGNPTTSQALINAVKNSGFNTVRIPCAWDCHATNGVIDANWFARIKRVVDYCISNNMYAIINIHWDGGWLEDNCTTSAQSSVNAKQKNYWTQIANYFKNYNEHLIFASANEPSANDATQMSVLLSYHQTFINAVRATGGNNSSRTLIIQGPGGADIDKTNALMNTMPTDQIAGRLMVEVHDYTPWQFCGLTADASWGSMFYYWGSGNHSTIEPSRNATWGEESEVERALGLMKTKFVDKGFPVLIGEFGTIKRNNPADMSKHIASREYFDKYIVSSAKAKGMVPVYWDNGASDFGIFNRSTAAVTDQGVINAIMQGAGGGSTTNYITLANRGTGLLIDGMGRTSAGSICGQYASSGSWNQMWILETSGAYVYIKNRNTGLYIDGRGVNTNGSYAGQWSSSTSYNLQWTMETVGSYVKFKNRATGLYLDGMGRTTNGSDLGQYASSSSNNQQWLSTTIQGQVAAPKELVKNNLTLSTESGATVFPNPFPSTFNIQVDKSQKILRIEILDATGRLIQTISSSPNNNYIQLGASLKQGVYVVKVVGENGTKSFKIIKAKAD